MKALYVNLFWYSLLGHKGYIALIKIKNEKYLVIYFHACASIYSDKIYKISHFQFDGKIMFRSRTTLNLKKIFKD